MAVIQTLWNMSSNIYNGGTIPFCMYEEDMCIYEMDIESESCEEKIVGVYDLGIPNKQKHQL